MLLVGNHTGRQHDARGRSCFTLAFSTYFGVERPLLPARPQPRRSPRRSGALLRRYGARSPPRTSTPRRRSRPAPRCSSTPAATGRSTGPPGRATRSTSPGARGSSGWPSTQDVPIVPVVTIGGQETALFLSRGDRLAKRAAARPALPAEGAADLARAALGPQRRRLPRPHPAAGEDHDRGAGRRSTCASSSAPSPTSTRSTSTSPRSMQETLDGLAAERRFPVIG